MQTNSVTKRQTEGIWANPKSPPGYKTKKEMVLIKEIAAKHSTQCIAALNRTNKRLASLCYCSTKE